MVLRFIVVVLLSVAQVHCSCTSVNFVCEQERIYVRCTNDKNQTDLVDTPLQCPGGVICNEESDTPCKELEQLELRLKNSTEETTLDRKAVETAITQYKTEKPTEEKSLRKKDEKPPKTSTLGNSAHSRSKDNSPGNGTSNLPTSRRKITRLRKERVKHIPEHSVYEKIIEYLNKIESMLKKKKTSQTALENIRVSDTASRISTHEQIKGYLHDWLTSLRNELENNTNLTELNGSDKQSPTATERFSRYVTQDGRRKQSEYKTEASQPPKFTEQTYKNKPRNSTSNHITQTTTVKPANTLSKFSTFQTVTSSIDIQSPINKRPQELLKNYEGTLPDVTISAIVDKIKSREEFQPTNDMSHSVPPTNETIEPFSGHITAPIELQTELQSKSPLTENLDSLHAVKHLQSENVHYTAEYEVATVAPTLASLADTVDLTSAFQLATTLPKPVSEPDENFKPTNLMSPNTSFAYDTKSKSDVTVVTSIYPTLVRHTSNIFDDSSSRLSKLSSIIEDTKLEGETTSNTNITGIHNDKLEVLESLLGHLSEAEHLLSALKNMSADSNVTGTPEIKINLPNDYNIYTIDTQDSLVTSTPFQTTLHLLTAKQDLVRTNHRSVDTLKSDENGEQATIQSPLEVLGRSDPISRNKTIQVNTCEQLILSSTEKFRDGTFTENPKNISSPSSDKNYTLCKQEKLDAVHLKFGNDIEEEENNSNISNSKDDETKDRKNSTELYLARESDLTLEPANMQRNENQMSTNSIVNNVINGHIEEEIAKESTFKEIPSKFTTQYNKEQSTRAIHEDETEIVFTPFSPTTQNQITNKPHEVTGADAERILPSLGDGETSASTESSITDLNAYPSSHYTSTFQPWPYWSSKYTGGGNERTADTITIAKAAEQFHSSTEFLNRESHGNTTPYPINFIQDSYKIVTTVNPLRETTIDRNKLTESNVDANMNVCGRICADDNEMTFDGSSASSSYSSSSYSTLCSDISWVDSSEESESDSSLPRHDFRSESKGISGLELESEQVSSEYLQPLQGSASSSTSRHNIFPPSRELSEAEIPSGVCEVSNNYCEIEYDSFDQEIMEKGRLMPFACPSEGNFPSNFCHMYHKCSHKITHSADYGFHHTLRKCRPNFYYSSKLRTCVPLDESDCQYGKPSENLYEESPIIYKEVTVNKECPECTDETDIHLTIMISLEVKLKPTEN